MVGCRVQMCKYVLIGYVCTRHIVMPKAKATLKRNSARAFIVCSLAMCQQKGEASTQQKAKLTLEPSLLLIFVRRQGEPSGEWMI